MPFGIWTLVGARKHGGGIRSTREETILRAKSIAYSDSDRSGDRYTQSHSAGRRPQKRYGGLECTTWGCISRSRVQILLEAALRNNLRQVVYTYVPLSPSSITWYRPKGGDSLRLVDDLRSPAGWLPVHRDQLRTKRSVSSMGSLYLYFYLTWGAQWRNLASGEYDWIARVRWRWALCEITLTTCYLFKCRQRRILCWLHVWSPILFTASFNQ